MDTFPDLGALQDQELKDLIEQLTTEEQEVSYQRRILHGKIDILRAELVNRLRRRREEGEAVITGADVQQLRHPQRQGHAAGPGPSGGLGPGTAGAVGCTARNVASSTPRARTTA